MTRSTSSGRRFRGDPASALLEVLDPDRIIRFSDHYLDVPFDLSKVLFLTTANMLDPIPPALRDRMEVLELPGTPRKKSCKSSERHLIRKQPKKTDSAASKIEFTDGAIAEIIRSYTRGVGAAQPRARDRSRRCRKIAQRHFRRRGAMPTQVTAEDVTLAISACRRFFSEVAERTNETGVATGLAWTPNGGEMIFIEATRMAGQKGLMLTGSLGDVMKESAQAAMSICALARRAAWDVRRTFSEELDIHIHVPAGAIPKDGPSAGVTLAAALASLLSGRPIKAELAMTGEITLRGKVMPVGGVKEKVLAARREGIKTMILPRRNERDLRIFPQRSAAS